MTYSNSQVQIGANALRMLGDDPITSLTDDSDRARLVNALLPEARRETLAAHPWNCSTRRAVWVRSEDEPAWGYAYQYPLASDALRVFEVEGEETYPWKREGRYIVTDNPTCKVRYAIDVEDPNEWDANVTKAITYLLAAKLALPVTGKSSLMDKLVALWIDARNEGRTMDGQEGTPQELLADVLINARWA
jgi:hypothetical protein